MESRNKKLSIGYVERNLKMKKLSLAIIVIFSAMLICGQAYAEMTLKGNVEINIDYDTSSNNVTTLNTETGVPDDTTTIDTDEKKYDMNGRIKITPNGKTQTGNFFFEAQVDILANLDSTVGLEDVWGKIGTDTFDIQIGRFEGIALFDIPEDINIVDAPDAPKRYEADAVRGRLDNPGQLAIHMIPNHMFNIELGTAYGTLETDVDETPQNDTDLDAIHSENLIGLRPVVLFIFGPIEAAMGMDYQSTSAQDDDAKYESNLLGFGGKIKATFGPASFSIEYAGKTEGGTDFRGRNIKDTDTHSLGGVALVTLGPGTLDGGVFHTTSKVDDSDNTQTHNQWYLSYTHPLLVDNVSIRYALSGATADDDLDSDEEGNLDSNALGVRVQLKYDF